MADQKLVVTHDVSFLVEQLFYLTKQTYNCWTKLALQSILTTFPRKHGSFTLSVDVFKKIHQKLNSPQMFMKCSLLVKSTQNFSACSSQNSNF